MSSASIVLAIAVAAWGPIAAPPGPTAAPAAAPAPSVAPVTGGVQPIAPPPPVAPPPRRAPEPALLAKAPLQVRGTPVLVGAPAAPAQKPLYKSWVFWLISGGLFAATVIATVLVTRPPPEPYTGNAPPFRVPLP
jgi:hypothetical protein